MKSNAYKRQTIALFFIVSLVPALVVAAVWYHETRSSDVTSLTISFKTFVLPVMLVGVLPALALSFVFAELLSRPIRKIHTEVTKLASGTYIEAPTDAGNGEFGKISSALANLSTIMRRTSDETKSQGDLVAAERNKLRGVLNSMTDGVFALDSGGRIILFNHAAATLTGHPITQAAGQLAEKIIPLRENGELVMERWLATERGRDHKIGQWRGLELYRADGTSLFVNVQAVVLPDDPNGIAALITFHDVSASHELEEMKVDFVALAAHELRTPLTEVRGYLDVLRHDVKRFTRDQVSLLDHAVSSAEQLTGLLNNLLSVARIEHGEINYQPVEIDYIEFMRELGTTLSDRAHLAGRQFTLKLPHRLPRLMADPVGLREVIRNLVDNAFIHTADSTGTVFVTVSSRGGQIETAISDNGEGIAAADQPRLFTKFYRAGETNQTRGTGLGLYICRRIVEAHGGTIEVVSAAGKGATFTFHLPIAPVADKRVTADNNITTRGAHGWIKNHTVR